MVVLLNYVEKRRCTIAGITVHISTSHFVIKQYKLGLQSFQMPTFSSGMHVLMVLTCMPLEVLQNAEYS